MSGVCSLVEICWWRCCSEQLLTLKLYILCWEHCDNSSHEPKRGRLKATGCPHVYSIVTRATVCVCVCAWMCLQWCRYVYKCLKMLKAKLKCAQRRMLTYIYTNAYTYLVCMCVCVHSKGSVCSKAHACQIFMQNGTQCKKISKLKNFCCAPQPALSLLPHRLPLI